MGSRVNRHISYFSFYQGGKHWVRVLYHSKVGILSLASSCACSDLVRPSLVGWVRAGTKAHFLVVFLLYVFPISLATKTLPVCKSDALTNFLGLRYFFLTHIFFLGLTWYGELGIKHAWIRELFLFDILLRVAYFPFSCVRLFLWEISVSWIFQSVFWSAYYTFCRRGGTTITCT